MMFVILQTMKILHWFRADLRMTDNTSLLQAATTAEAVLAYQSLHLQCFHCLARDCHRHYAEGFPDFDKLSNRITPERAHFERGALTN